jgi:multiple sugar transport system substrate-binding protein
MSRKSQGGLCRNVRASAQRLGLASAGICLLLAFLVGCARPTPPPEPVTISFAYPDWYGGYFEALLDEFHESHPHITVELRAIPNSVFVQSFWAGDADAFVGGLRPRNLRMMLEQDLIVDLRPFIKTDIDFNREDFYLGEAGFLTHDQSIWGLPIGTYMTVMYYNKDLFDQHGIAYPEPGWTWADFVEIGLALRDPAADVFGYVAINTSGTSGTSSTAGASNFGAGSINAFGIASLVYQHDGQVFDDLQNPTYATFDDPLSVEALEWYTTLFLEHNIAPTPEQAREAFGGNTRDAIYRAIQQGQVGMWTGGIWQQGIWEEDGAQTFRWGMAPLPREVQAASLGMGEYLFVFQDAQHPEECWQWMTFVSEHMAPEWLAPVRKSQAESEPYEQLVGDELATAVRATADDILVVSPKVRSELDILNQVAERVITGRETPSEALEWAQRQAEKALP